MRTHTLNAIDTIVNQGADADDVLRAVVAELARQPGIRWVGVRFLEDGELTLGPEAGARDETLQMSVPVSYHGTQVGELAIAGSADIAFLERVALVISAHVLLGWDTGGEAWEP